MERKEQIKNIKALESEFLHKVEDLIQNKYLDLMFDKYKNSVKEISECYKNPNIKFLESTTCAQTSMEKYFDKEKRFERLFHHYEVYEYLKIFHFFRIRSQNVLDYVALI